MSKQHENQLSEHIKQVLHNHEEPYVLGSWERFKRAKTRKEKIKTHRLYISVAASILLALTSLFAWITMDNTAEQQTVNQTRVERPDDSNNPPTDLYTDSANQPSDNTYKEGEQSGNDPADVETTETTAPDEFRQSTRIYRHSPVPQRDVPQYTLGNDQVAGSPLMSEDVEQRPSTLTFNKSSSLNPDGSGSSYIVREGDLRRSAQRDQQKEVVFSLAYASTMNVHHSQTDLGVGGGFYTDWNFSKNVSISSGVFITENQLKYKKTQNVLLQEDVEENKPGTLDSEDLSYIQLDLVNLEIPLNVRYRFAENLSVSAGISSVAFLKEQFKYNFEYERRIQVFEGPLTTDDETTVPVTRVITLETSKTEAEPTLNRMDWAAFYTLSVGYQRNLFERYTATFEPFVKIPAGKITSRNITYTAGGLQLKISF